MTAPSGAVIPLSIFKISGRASALCGMAVEASRRPTINIVPRRIRIPSEAIGHPVTAMARTVQRRQGTPGSIGSQSVYKIG
jgi:hypothetical protein